MLLFRSLALGLAGACLLLLATRPSYEVRIVRDRPAAVHVLPPASATIIDVAAGVTVAQLPALIHLGEGEHVTAIDDRDVRDDLEAGTMLAAHRLGGNRFIDLTIAGPEGSRRVLVLLH